VGANRPHLAPLVGPPLVGATSVYAPTVTYHPGKSVTYLTGSCKWAATLAPDPRENAQRGIPKV